MVVDILVPTRHTMGAKIVCFLSRQNAYMKRSLAGEHTKGEDFAKVASDLSDDPSAENNGGRIGYLTVLYPDGFYPLETAAYEKTAS